MVDKEFVIENLGIFEYVATLVCFDYPETFVARMKTDDTAFKLFLFEQIHSSEVSVSWAATRITYEQFDSLNEGNIKLSDCFYGKRGMPKKGYIVTSSAGKERATKEDVGDIASVIPHDIDFYVDSFVSGDHGVNTLSLATGGKVVGIIADEKEFADPFIDGSIVENIVKSSRTFYTDLPLGVVVKGYHVAYNHSVVIGLQILPKEDGAVRSTGSLELFPEAENQKNQMVEDAVDILEMSLSSEDNETELLGALSGSKKTIERVEKLAKSIRKANPKGDTSIVFSSVSGKPRKTLTINHETEKVIKERSKKMIEHIDSAEKKKNSFPHTGIFVMFDGTKENGRFAFRDVSNGFVYKGISRIPIKKFSDSGETLELFGLRDNVVIDEEVLCFEGKEAKPIYYLKNTGTCSQTVQLELDLPK